MVGPFFARLHPCLQICLNQVKRNLEIGWEEGKRITCVSSKTDKVLGQLSFNFFVAIK